MLWQAQVDLHANDFDITWGETGEQETIGDGFAIAAQIRVKPVYLTAHINFAPQAVKDFRSDFDAFRRTVYHEVAHIIIDPLYLDQQDELSRIERHYFNALRETAVEKVARIGRRRRDLTNELEALKKRMRKKSKEGKGVS